MITYFKEKCGFGNPRDWTLTNGNLVSTFVYRPALFKANGSYPHYTIIGVKHSLRTEDERDYDVWEFDNFHLSVEAATHYYYREYKDGYFAYKGANTLRYVDGDLPHVDESVAIFTTDYLLARLAALHPDDYKLKVSPEEYKTFQQGKESRLQSVIDNNKSGIIRDWTTPGKWNPRRVPNEPEHKILCKHYNVDPLLISPADWITVIGQDKAPAPKPVPDVAKNGSNIALAAAKSTVISPQDGGSKV